jgi:hypothetical protein
MKNFKRLIQDSMFILGGIFALYIAYITGTGEILNYIHFADPLNEMFFCCASLSLGIGCIIAGFSKA